MDDAGLQQRADESERRIAQAYGDAADKVRENRLRRAAERQGYQLKKSRRRDPRAYDYGLYWIVDPDRNTIVSGERGSGLDQIEGWLYPDQMRSGPEA